MFQTLSKSSGSVIGVRIKGKVTEDDYDRLVPELERIIEAYGELNLLVQFDGFSGIEPAAVWEDLKFDVAHLRDVARWAIVKDQDWQGWLGRLTSPLSGIDVRIFEPDEMDDAWAWLRADAVAPYAPRTNGRDPRRHVRAVRARLKALTDSLRRDAARLEDPSGAALFETGAEVLGGLNRAFTHYEERTEEAWQES